MLRTSVRILLCLALLLAGLWGAFALWFQLPAAAPVRVAVITGWSLLAMAAALPARSWRGLRPWLLTGFALAMAVLLAWWSTLSPSHQRDWADDVARLLEADVDGRQVTLHNVRNFHWRSPTDYTPQWETRRYDLDRLVSADLVLSYWMGPMIAHTLVSFGFEDGERVVFSLEIRKERHESFSALGGFFREFEQVLVAADENDIVRVRSNARLEDVYLYRLALPPEALREVFLGYVEEAGQLRRQPAFYNTLTSNCTTVVFDLARRIAPGIPADYRLLLSGYFARYAFDQGALTPGFSYAELQARGHINPRTARLSDTDGSATFSRVIRQGLPGVPAQEQAP